MSGEKYTLDTNILLYSIDRHAGERHKKSIELIEQMSRCDCILTLQALSEFYSAVTRKGKMPNADAQAQVGDWMILFSVVTAAPAVLQRAMQVVGEHQLSFWDAMLLETAVNANVTRFLSEDQQYGRLWKGMTIENPFELV
ncbi:MAG: PIN domain-containing protein [Gammaproteobacteria bacterium]|nr:PIN domain-containing protein [Gammaproteobacteria bacterium]